ncbi:Nuclear receptor domain-containing protein [Meloidogyne graminicola]|uniref:Nuclear receptor domain-containing protein n=1 Tax=Meloidogyne graminicola TaxID=189291 RepID=A0A8S9ZG61_9BILA|nr:Nuclear receptor domain-containing protein [Meloidogyne graminicola]
MDTTAQTQNNNLSQFWATAQTSIPITSTSLGFVFHSFQQSHRAPEILIPSTFSNIQQNSSTISANPSSFDATSAARFAQHLLPTRTTQFSTFVNFDCMGLMNNFGLTNGQINHSQQCDNVFSVTPFTPTTANVQSPSAALIPFSMNNIYVNKDVSNTNGVGINIPPFIQKPTPQVRQPNSLLNNQQIDSTTQMHLMDLSSQTVLNPSNDNLNKGSLSIVSNDVSNTNINEFVNLQLTAIKNENESIGQQSAFCTFSGGKIKQEIVNIPKETATIPLESSQEASYSSSSELRPQTQLSCQVCHLAASNGLHFGARTCAACAAFFRRSISDQKRYICKRSQRCVIRPNDIGSQGYRKICRDCRMKRCLDIGMLPENVQNKRNKRDYFFADALNNVIQQKEIEQSMEEINKQRQIQSITRTELDKILGPNFNKFTEFNETNSLTALTQQNLLTSTLINDNAKNSFSNAFNFCQIKNANSEPLYPNSMVNQNERSLQRITGWNQ